MEKNNKIVFVLNNIAGGGIARVVTTFANQIAQMGTHQVYLVVMHKKAPLYALHPSIHLIENNATRKSGGKISYIFRSVLFIRRAVKSIGECTVIVNGEWLNAFVYLCLKGIVNKVYLADHSNPQRSGQSPFPFVDNFVYPRATGVLVLSEAAKQKVAQQYAQKNILLLDNPVTFPAQAIVSKQQAIICMGRLSTEKGQDVLIEAFSKVKNDWKLWFLGDGPSRKELEILAQNLGVANRIVFLGMQQDTAFYLNQASIYVMPSLTENFPMALVEAMSLGLPCIATDCMPWRKQDDFIVDEFNGLKVPVANSDALAQAIDRLVFDEQLRENLGKNAANIKQQFNIESTVNKFMEYIS
ncbi:glycosyltransferase [Pedobacter sp.]